MSFDLLSLGDGDEGWGWGVVLGFGEVVVSYDIDPGDFPRTRGEGDLPPNPSTQHSSSFHHSPRTTTIKNKS